MNDTDKPVDQDSRTLEFVMSPVGGEGSAQALFVRTYIDGKEYLSLATPSDVNRARADELNRVPRKQQVLGYGGDMPYLSKSYLKDRLRELNSDGFKEAV